MLILPEWMPLEAWNSYLEMRKRHRWVLTERAEDGLIRKLAAFRDQGYDVEAILDEASEANWRGVFVNERTPRVMRDSSGNAYDVDGNGMRVYRRVQ